MYAWPRSEHVYSDNVKAIETHRGVYQLDSISTQIAKILPFSQS